MSIEILKQNIAIMQQMCEPGAVVYRQERNATGEWEKRDAIPDKPNWYRYSYKVVIEPVHTVDSYTVDSYIGKINSAMADGRFGDAADYSASLADYIRANS